MLDCFSVLPLCNFPDANSRTQADLSVKAWPLLSGFAFAIPVRKNFSKESDRVAGEFNMGGSFKGGRHIKVQMDLSVTTKEKLKELFTELKRKIEDVLIENFNKPALSSFGNNFNEEKQRLADAEIKLHEIYKLLTDSPKSWEVKIFGELSQTKDFNLNEN